MKDPKETFFYLFDHHASGLDAGNYEITVSQKIDNVGSLEESSYKFTVGKELFELTANQIHTVYPTPDSVGSNAYHLPHILLNNSTLPWEAHPKGGKHGDPFLFLLLFDESEFSHLDLRTVVNEDNKETRTILTLPATLLSKFFINSATETLVTNKCLETLRSLTHVRVLEEGKEVKSRQACILGNRLPKAGSQSVVHLVSLAYAPDNSSFDFSSLQKEGNVQLYSLYSYNFSTNEISSQKDESDLHFGLSKLNVSVINSGTNEENNKAAGKLMQEAFVPLLHHLRTGDQRYSLYRGPLVPPSTTEIDLPLATSSDQLLREEAETAMVDTSYAAAWNLGRYLALNSRTLVKALVNWKRSHAHDVKQRRVHQVFEMASVHENLPIQQQLLNEESPSFELPEVVGQAIQNWSKLAEIPMGYLVPDKKILPKESIRFFKVDKSWTKALLNGVFEVGFAGLSSERDNALWNQFYAESIKKDNHTNVGYIMQSQLLVDFPTMELLGLDESKNVINPIRILREGELAMILFNQPVAEVVFSMPDHSMHASFEHKPDTGLVLTLKELTENNEVNVSFLSNSKGIINIPDLVKEVEKKASTNSSASFGSSELAYHLLKNGTAFCFTFSHG